MNYSVTKSNPDIWDLISFLDSNIKTSDWTIVKTARPNDLLFIGLSGKDAGIYAVARVCSAPQLTSEQDDEFTKTKGWFEKPRWRSRVQIIKSKANNPILEEELTNTFPLSDVSEWLHRQGASRLLFPEEAKALMKLFGIK